VDVLDDGFKWRKYGKKAVKSSTNPRELLPLLGGGLPSEEARGEGPRRPALRRHRIRRRPQHHAAGAGVAGHHRHTPPRLLTYGGCSYMLQRPTPPNHPTDGESLFTQCKYMFEEHAW
jgi:hypothetical protein